MAYTKDVGRHDEILLDTVDVSNSFRTFNFAGENATIDVTGFSATGNTETLPGARTSSFEGEAYYTPELENILRPAFFNRTIVSVSWQRNGLTTGNFDTYTGECYVNQWNPGSEVGAVGTVQVRLDPADATGITGT